MHVLDDRRGRNATETDRQKGSLSQWTTVSATNNHISTVSTHPILIVDDVRLQIVGNHLNPLVMADQFGPYCGKLQQTRSKGLVRGTPSF